MQELNIKQRNKIEQYVNYLSDVSKIVELPKNFDEAVDQAVNDEMNQNELIEKGIIDQEDAVQPNWSEYLKTENIEDEKSEANDVK